jgi:hypothetical protein
MAPLDARESLDALESATVPDPSGWPEGLEDAGDRAAGRRDFAAQRVRELRARTAEHPSSVDTATDAATALASARRRADAAERSAAIAHESAALAHERAAHAHDLAAQGSTGPTRERHEARAEALRAHADQEREAAAQHEEAPADP